MKMYLSSLLIDIGKNPDRPRPGRLWLRNRYRVHQRLCMAFPSLSRSSDDENFLMPFRSEDFGIAVISDTNKIKRIIHVQRNKDQNFMFRIDPRKGGRAVILVQSGVEPNWDYAFHNAKHFLATPPQIKEYNPCFSNDQTLQFRLEANPTKKIDTKSGTDGRRRHGRRVITNPEEWLLRKAMNSGFYLQKESLSMEKTYPYVNKPMRDEKEENCLNEDRAKKKKAIKMVSVRYEGVLQVTDEAKFNEAIVNGIGSGKSFGFGLLSVVPVR